MLGLGLLFAGAFPYVPPTTTISLLASDTLITSDTVFV